MGKVKTFHYQDLAEFHAELEDHRKKRPSIEEAADHSSSDDFVGMPIRKVKNELKWSWPEGAEMLSHLPELGQVENAHSGKVKTWSHYDGDTMCVERFRDDRPFLRRRQKKRTARVQRVVISITESGIVDADDMIWKTYAAARIIDDLESQGVRCEVLAYIGVTYKHDVKKGFITLKRPNECLNIGSICTAISPWMLRVWGFHWIDAKYGYKPSGYGQPVEYKPDPELEEIVINRGDCLSKSSAIKFIQNLSI